MYRSILKVLKKLSFSKLSFKLASVYLFMILPQSSDLFSKSSDMHIKCGANKKQLPMCNKGGQVTKPIMLMKICYKLLFVIQVVLNIFDR